jgi:hypothetical protein
MRKGFLIYEEMRKYFPIDEEAVSHKCLGNCSILNFIIYEENLIFFFISVLYCILFNFFVGSLSISCLDSSPSEVGHASPSPLDQCGGEGSWRGPSLANLRYQPPASPTSGTNLQLRQSQVPNSSLANLRSVPTLPTSGTNLQPLQPQVPTSNLAKLQPQLWGGGGG